MNKVNEKKGSNNKEKYNQRLSPIRVWACNNDLPNLSFWGLAIFGIYRSSSTNITKRQALIAINKTPFPVTFSMYLDLSLINSSRNLLIAWLVTLWMPDKLRRWSQWQGSSNCTGEHQILRQDFLVDAIPKELRRWFKDRTVGLNLL